MMANKTSQNDDLIPLLPTEEHRVLASRGLTFPVKFVRADGDVIHYTDDRGRAARCHRAEFLRVIRALSP